MKAQRTLEKCKKCAPRVAKFVFVGNIVLGIMKMGLGIFAQSASLTADGLQSLACAGVGIFVIAGLKISQKPADQKFPYGYGKVEFLVSVVSYAGLFGLGFFMLCGSGCLIIGGRFSGPMSISLPVAAISMLANYLMYASCLCAGNVTGSAGLLANAKQNQADMFSSSAVMISVALAQLGPSFYWCDSLGAGIVGVFIMKDSALCWWSDMSVLLDTSLPEGRISQIHTSAVSVQGIKQTLFVRARRIGQSVGVDLGVIVPEEQSLSSALELSTEARTTIMRRLNWVEDIDVYVYPADRGVKPEIVI
ncbi:cation diffusion facilitator family transporter [Planctomycetota bacterium]